MSNVMADGTAKAICDFLAATALSVKADGVAVSAPGDGALLIAGYSGGQSRYATAGAFDNGTADETLIALFVRAAVTGRDLTASALSRNAAISSDLVSNNDNRATNTVQALYGLSVISGTDIGNSTVLRLVSATSNITAQAYTGRRLCVDAVTRGDDGSTYSAVAARTVANYAGVAQTFVALNTLANLFGVNSVGGGQEQVVVDRDIITANGGSLLVLENRASGYRGSRAGRRYVCKSPDLTGVAAATALTLTAPTFLAVAGATKEIVVRRITVTLPVIGTSTTFQALVKTDTANRFSSGGTARAPGTMNQGNTIATGLAQNLETPTATAESAAVGVSSKAGPITSGAQIEFLFLDGLIVPASGSLLLYVVTGTAGATVHYEVEFEEVNVQ